MPPPHKPKTNKDASGAIVLIYHDKLPRKYVMGEETDYVTDISSITKSYRTPSGETLHEAFLAPVTIHTSTSLIAAKQKFATSCDELEKAHGYRLGRITFADIKNSSKPGKISAKPRYVKVDRRGKYGFPKGSYESIDGTLEDTAIREMEEELGIKLSKNSLKDVNQLVLTGGNTYYAVYHYKLNDLEYKALTLSIQSKNNGREAELQSLDFREIPKDTSAFFTNQASKRAYQSVKVPGGSRRTRTVKNRRVKSRGQ